MKQIHLLLAEDNDGDVFLVHYALHHRQLDYTLDLVTNGDQAAARLAAIARREPGVTFPDVFILDLNLPRTSGYELLQQFRSFCTAVPVVIFTSSDAPADIARAIQAGANRYFRKPSDLDGFLQLGAVVEEVVEESGPGGGNPTGGHPLLQPHA